MKKILFLTNYPSPYRVRFFDQLAKEAEVTVLFADRIQEKTHRSAAWYVEGQGEFHAVQLTKRLGKVGTNSLCTDVIPWLKKDFDQIVVCGYSHPTAILAMVYMRLNRIPFWMEIDGGIIRQEGKMKYLLKKSLVTLAKQWLSTGPYPTDYLVHYGASRERVREYPFSSLKEGDILPAPVTREEKTLLRRELEIREEKVILSIGQFIHRKGFDVLLKAAAKLPEDVGIYIVGGEPTQEYLAMRDSLGLKNVHFVGFQKKDELARYYRAADLFTLPTREDIWGLVVNEAMAFALPVITTDRCVAGLVLVEEGKSGYIVPVGDPDALAEKMNLALAGDLAQMGAAALERIRPYTIENMARVHHQILGERS